MKASTICLRRPNEGVGTQIPLKTKETVKLWLCLSVQIQNILREGDVSFHAFLFGLKIGASGWFHVPVTLFLHLKLWKNQSLL